MIIDDRLISPVFPFFQTLQSLALAKMDMLVTKTEELAENILKWREQQKEVSSCIPTILAEDYLHKHDVTMSLPFTSKVHVQTVNAK